MEHDVWADLSIRLRGGWGSGTWREFYSAFYLYRDGPVSIGSKAWAQSCQLAAMRIIGAGTRSDRHFDKAAQALKRRGLLKYSRAHGAWLRLPLKKEESPNA